MTVLKVPPYLSEVKPEEHAFILLERRRMKEWRNHVAFLLCATPVFDVPHYAKQARSRPSKALSSLR